MSLLLQAIHHESSALDPISLPDGDRTIRVGRLEDNDVQINHTSISAKHALLKGSETNGVELVDCDSSNGTFVNGVKVERSELHLGDVVKFAYLSYRVVDDEGNDGDWAQPTEPVRVLATTAQSSEEERKLSGSLEKEGVSGFGGGANEQELERLKSERDQVSMELSGAKEEIAKLRGQLKSEQARFETEKDALETKLSAAVSENQRLTEELQSETASRRNAESELATRTRERDELTQKLEKARIDAQARGAEILERDKSIAAVQFEREGLSRKLANTEDSVKSLEADCVQWRDAYETLKSTLEGTQAELQESQERGANLQERLQYFLDEFRKYLSQLHKDLAFWKIEGLSEDAKTLEALEDCFSEGEILRTSMRQVLDEVEPIWEAYGSRVREELERRVVDLNAELSELDTKREEKTAEVESLIEDVKGLREEVDIEVRRAQGLSRRGVQIEIPERFESMVIAQDRERQILLSLVGTLEFLEQLITGYRRSRKLREVVYELEEFQKRIVRILEANGVKEFSLEPGIELTLKHRKEVQILGKKGWGTREYAEQPFHPGVVQKVIRSGYRAGQGEGSVLLRKVEVLIRETES